MGRRLELCFPALLGGGLLFAQPAKWSASVPAVERDGLHAITLGAELLGCSRADLGDIRLLDSTGAQVPYVIKQVRSEAAFGSFVPYAMLRNEVLTHSTVIEFERPTDELIDMLHIWIRPLEGEKKVRITGSDDRKAWYMVKDEHLVTQGARGDPPHQVLIVDLPRSDYRYFRLAMNDSLTAPMRVLGVGRFTDGTGSEARYLDSGPIAFAQRDSAGRSTLTMRAERPVLVDRFGYAVSDTIDYRRTGSLRAWRTIRTGERRKRTWTRVPRSIDAFAIASDRSPIISLTSVRLDTFDIVIDNGDDRPLHFTQLRPQVAHRVLLAAMQPGMRYELTTGNSALAPPRYDMAHFADELSAPLDTLDHGALREAPAQMAGIPAFDPSKWWVWAAIIALMLGMGWMALRMLRSGRA